MLSKAREISDKRAMRGELEDLAQSLSKLFKDAAKLRIRWNQKPEIVPVQRKIEKALESKAVLAYASKNILTALKEVATSMRRVVRESRDPNGGLPPPPREQWAVLEQHLTVPYEELAGLMRLAGMHVPQVRNFKLARSLYHASSSIGVVVMSELVWTTQDLIIVSITSCIGMWFMEWLKNNSEFFKRLLFKLLGSISRDGEQHNVNSATWYITSLAALSLLFGKLPGCLGVLALGVGDPAAALIGSKLGSIKLYGKKTLEGSMAFVFASFIAFMVYASLLYDIPLVPLVQIAGVAAVTGAIAELYCPVPTIDDNLLVPVATAAAVTLFLSLYSESMELPGGVPAYADRFDWAGVQITIEELLHKKLPFTFPDRLPPTHGMFLGSPVEILYQFVPTKPYF
jgi:dolichol kinase